MPETRAAAGPLRESDILAAAAEDPWLPAMAGMLARPRWELLEQQSGLSKANYGTARVLAGDAGVPRTVAAEFVLPAAFGRPEPVLVETLPFVGAYSRLGLRLTQSVPPSASNRLLEGFGAIAQIDGVARAVGGVLAAVHVLDVPSPDHDVSFSDPAVPFSVFVGVHGVPVPNDALRMAEQLVHECMHLQLTLLEAAHPLVSGDVEKHWSPWQETMRPTRGVLHGLYVFSVLDAFFAELARLRDLTVGEAEHLEIRRREIEAETGQAAAALAGSAELTTFGRAFLAALLAPGKAVALGRAWRGPCRKDVPWPGRPNTAPASHQGLEAPVSHVPGGQPHRELPRWPAAPRIGTWRGAPHGDQRAVEHLMRMLANEG